MTRQRLREGSIRWETNLSLESFSQKIVKKIEMLAFNNKIKIIKAFVPNKVKLYIETNLSKELNHFQKKYSYKIDFIEKAQFIIPEYSIELLNKSKKIIDKIEYIRKVKDFNYTSDKSTKIAKIDKKNQKILTKKNKIKDEIKKEKKPRTLWTRRKKAS